MVVVRTIKETQGLALALEVLIEAAKSGKDAAG